MINIYAVTGYNTEDEQTDENLQVVLMSDTNDTLPSVEDIDHDHDEFLPYYDENIYFYGISVESLQETINMKGNFGEFSPISFDLDGQFDPLDLQN